LQIPENDSKKRIQATERKCHPVSFLYSSRHNDPHWFVSLVRFLHEHAFPGELLLAFFHFKRRNTLQFTLNAPALLQALKSINIRMQIHEFVHIQAHDGKLTLTTCTKPPTRWRELDRPRMRASISMTEGLSIKENEGSLSVNYQALVSAIKMVDGPVTLRQDGQVLIVERPGELKHQTPIEGNDFFPQPPAIPEKGTNYSKNERQWVTCPTCGQGHSQEHQDLYQILGVITQQIRFARERFLSTLKHIEWAVASEDRRCRSDDGRTGVFLSLFDGFLILQARDGYSVARYREPATSGGDFQQSVLIPAKQLKQALQLLPRKMDVSLEAIFVQHQHVKRDGQDVLDIALSTRAKEIRLSAGDMCITLSLLNDGSPDYQTFFADTTARETQVVCSTADLLLAVKAAGSVAEQQRSPIQFRVDEKQINLETGSSSSPALHQVLLVAKTGPDLSIALNAWYLRQALSVITTGEVKIEIGAPDKPVVIRPMSEQDTFACAMTPMKTYE